MDLGHASEDEEFVLSGGVGDDELEHEAVDLCFGEGVGSLLVDGVLGGEDEEGVRELEGVVADGDLAFLHGLEEGALDFGGGAVDFVGEDDVGEDGAFPGGEVAGAGGVEHGSDDGGGEEVGSELDAVEGGGEGSCEAGDGEGLGESGESLDEDMVVAEEGEDELADEILLSDDDSSHLVLYLVELAGCLLDVCPGVGVGAGWVGGVGGEAKR